MATWLKLSTAVDVKVGPFVDSTDGFTPETALTITQPDIRLGKNGGAFAQKNAAQTLTHEENGWYEVALDATDTGTLGILILAIYEVGALPVWREFMVVPANVYDGLISGTGVGPRADVQGWLGTAPATPTVNGVPEVDLTHWLGTAAAVPTVAGVPEVDVTHWIGTAAATPTVAGVPEVDPTHWRGTALPAELVAGHPIVTIQGVLNQLDDLNNVSVAQVGTEVGDALNTDANSEPGQGAPTANAPLGTKLAYLYKWARNRKTQTSTLLSLYNDDAITVDQKASVGDDGTTLDRGEIATGP